MLCTLWSNVNYCVICCSLLYYIFSTYNIFSPYNITGEIETSKVHQRQADMGCTSGYYKMHRYFHPTVLLMRWTLLIINHVRCWQNHMQPEIFMIHPSCSNRNIINRWQGKEISIITVSWLIKVIKQRQHRTRVQALGLDYLFY